MSNRIHFPNLARVLAQAGRLPDPERARVATGRRNGNGWGNRGRRRWGTGQDGAGALMQGHPRGDDIGPACRPRYSGPYPFEGLEACKPYGDFAECRDYVLPFDSEDPVPAGVQVDIEQEPQVPFVGKRLVIGGTIAPGFLINDIIVGKNSQFVSPGAVPAEMFSHDAVGVALAIDPAFPGKIIVLRVTNVSGEDLRFNAGMIGNAVE